MRDRMRIYSLMAAGKPLTEHLAEVLFVNAYEMFDMQRERQEIRSRAYFGYMTTNLQIVTHWGTPCVVFESVVTEVQEKWGVNQVYFIVRIDDLNVPPNVAFHKIMGMENGPMPPMDLQRVKDDDEPEWDTGEPIYG